MKRKALAAAKLVTPLAALATAGLLVGLALAPAADAYSIGELSGLGYSVAHVVDVSPPPGVCPESYRIVGFGSSIELPTCDPDFQTKLDDFVRATCPCAQTTAPPSTTAAVTVTVTQTTPPPPPPPVTTEPTTTTASTIEDAVAALSARVKQLEDQIAALTTRVERLELAGQAAELAFDQAIASGMDVPSAVSLARGTFLNAEYGLGAFAS